MKNSTSDTFPLLRETMRHRYPQLSDADLEFAPGEEEKLLRHLQQRTGDSRETIAILLRSTGVNLPAPWGPPRGDQAGADGGTNTRADIDHSRGSGIPDDTSRSGGRSI